MNLRLFLFKRLRMNVFVYGTLKRDFDNEFAKFLHINSEFVGEAFVKGRLFLLDWYPGLVLDHEGYKVYGEVFKIKHNLKEVVEMLDEYEGVEENLYKKTESKVTVENKEITAFIYESLHISKTELIEGIFTSNR